tara:strand:+ start:2278 stop:3036 length:759 start_codon:yes stop_codon:yes gene_type:complete
MKNIVFQVKIKGKRHRPEFDISTKSWRAWATKNDCELLILDEFVRPEEYMKANWQKWFIFDLLENNNIEYDQILVVDADTIVHPNCPNFFDETEHKLCVVRNDGCFEWVLRSIRKYKDFLFKDFDVDVWDYFNSGFVILNKKHKPFIKEVQKWYDQNVDNIIWAEKNIKASTEQTPLNFLVKKHNVDIKQLSEKYNLQDMFRKNLLHIPGHSWWSDELHFLNAGWVYHFNAIPNNPRDVGYWMARTYKHLYE